jgi:two-component system nitrate/nitrite response regulator NarL
MSATLDDLRVLVVADDPLVRTGLAMLLAEQADCTVAGQLTGEADLLAESDVYSPDIILWDLGWDPLSAAPAPPRENSTEESPARTLFEALAELQEAEIPVVVLLPDETHSGQVWSAGVRGLLSREASIETIAAALQAVARGLIVLEPGFSGGLITAQELSPPPLVDELTPREREVLQLLAEGLPNKAIARRLNISDHTVKFHVNAIMTKLAAQSRTEAVVRATRLGLILL